MTIFNKIDVFLWPERGWRVQWSLNNISDIDPNDHEILVERGYGDNGPWKEAARISLNDVIYEDRSRVRRSIWDRTYYRLSIVNTGTQAIVHQSRPETLGAEPDIVSKEIIRQHDLLLYGVNIDNF